MVEPAVEGIPAPETDLPGFSFEFDSISIPPPPFRDHFYNFSSDLRFLVDGDGDFELNFDSVDDLYFPSENESFVIPVDATNREISGDFTSVSGISGTSSCCNLESPMDSDCLGTAQSLSLSSQESANGLSDVSEATIRSSSSPQSGKVMADQKFKVEEEAATKSITKRKKVIEEDTSEEFRNNKYRRSEEDGAASDVTGFEEHDEKKNAKLIRNRESAQLSRQRKKHYVEDLEEKVKNLHSTIKELNGKMTYFMAENATLRQQVVPGNGMSRPLHLPPAGMYPPLVPMPYPWMPCMVKPQGSRVPLLPIPRLKPHQSVGKVKKKTKKVASISVLGLLFCLFLFGALAPIVNVSYGGISGAFYGEYDQLRRRVVDVSGNSNRAHCGRVADQGVGRNISATENSVPLGNGSEPLVASLFVPRNEKLVKIDGSLIIHSVLASEKAMASETKNEGKSGVATTKGLSIALPSPDFRRTGDMSKQLYSEKQKALSSSGSDDTSKDQLKSTTANGKTQQWFREGVAGPLFSSGMCTQVFQFEVSSTSGAIIPASPATKQTKNTTGTHERKKNRRILGGSLPTSNVNLTKDQNTSSKENFWETKLGPSMVVSVLVDPREGGDGDIDRMMGGTKSLSRVFVVVLVDGVKYVTYSCVLPQPEVPPLVTN